jgi:hypothetical protein
MAVQAQGARGLPHGHARHRQGRPGQAEGPLQDYAQCGHVVAAGGKVEIVFTSVKSSRGYSIDRFYCTVQSESALSCFNIDGIGKEDDLFRIERIGRTLASPDGQMDDVCPARERPQV